MACSFARKIAYYVKGLCRNSITQAVCLVPEETLATKVAPLAVIAANCRARAGLFPVVIGTSGQCAHQTPRWAVLSDPTGERCGSMSSVASQRAHQTPDVTVSAHCRLRSPRSTQRRPDWAAPR